MPTIQVQNLTEVLSQMNRIRYGYNDRDVAKVLLEEGGKPMRDALRDAAPLGPTGNLRRAIQARIAKDKALAPAVYVAVKRSIAHHLHLVTGGTKPHEIRPKTKQALSIPIPGASSRVVVRSAHHPGAKANTYFRDTWETYQTNIANAITEALGKLWDRKAV